MASLSRVSCADRQIGTRLCRQLRLLRSLRPGEQTRCANKAHERTNGRNDCHPGAETCFRFPDSDGKKAAYSKKPITTTTSTGRPRTPSRTQQPPAAFGEQDRLESEGLVLTRAEPRIQIARSGAVMPRLPGRRLDAAVVAAAPPCDATNRRAVVTFVAAGAAFGFIVERAARDRAVNVNDERTRTHLSLSGGVAASRTERPRPYSARVVLWCVGWAIRVARMSYGSTGLVVNQQPAHPCGTFTRSGPRGTYGSGRA